MDITIGRRHILLALLLVGSILVLHYVGILRPVEQGIVSIVTPSIRSLSRLGNAITNLREYLTEKRQLVQTIRTLEETLTKQQLDRTERILLVEENEALRNLIAFKQRTKTVPIVSYVVGKSIDNTANTVIIDKGADDGIIHESPVMVGDGVLVGKIAKVNPRTAVVRLLNDPQSKIAATVLNRDGSIGLVEGGVGISVTLTTVLQTDTLAPGDIVVTSGLEALMPRGLLIGTIARIEKESYRPFQEATLTAAAPLTRLTLVGVLPPP